MAAGRGGGARRSAHCGRRRRTRLGEACADALTDSDTSGAVLAVGVRTPGAVMPDVGESVRNARPLRPAGAGDAARRADRQRRPRRRGRRHDRRGDRPPRCDRRDRRRRPLRCRMLARGAAPGAPRRPSSTGPERSRHMPTTGSPRPTGRFAMPTTSSPPPVLRSRSSERVSTPTTPVSTPPPRHSRGCRANAGRSRPSSRASIGRRSRWPVTSPPSASRSPSSTQYSPH